MPHTFPTATLFGTHTRKLTSSIVGIEYEISVWLPPDYESALEKTYPVLYILDSDLLFGTAAHMGWLLIIGGEAPPMIIIGIGWHIHSFEHWQSERNRDLAPWVEAEFPGSGGGSKFLSFIETELMPFVNLNYRTDPMNQNLVGYSLGGTFALYALLSKPGLFRGVSAGSPDVILSQPNVVQYEKEFARRSSALPASVYISVGSLEEDYGHAVEVFCKVFASRQYEGLTLKTEVFPGETHLSGIARSVVTGIKAIFSS